MKRIAYTHREFRLCEWPEKPSFDDQLKAWLNNVKIPLCANFNHCHTCRNLPKEHQACPCDEAVTSAMENGVAFADQNIARCRVYDIINRPDGAIGKTTFVGENVWQPKEGDNWPAPQGAEIVTKGICCSPLEGGINHHGYCDECPNYKEGKFAVLKSESVEKKESRCTLSDKELVEAIHKLVTKQCKTGQGWLMTVPVDFNRDSDMLISELIKRFEELQSIANRLNQSTPKE